MSGELAGQDKKGARPRVLFLAQLPPPVHGQSAMARATHDALTAAGSAITPIWGGGAVRNEDVGRRSFGKYLGFAAMLGRLAAMGLTGRRFDIAYLGLVPWAHTLLRDALLAAAARILARRAWVHVHGDGLKDVLERRGLKGAVIRHLLSGTELIAVTAQAAEEARRSGVFSRVFELPNLAADPGEPEPHERDELMVACLCNLDPRKGVLDFVEAVGAAVHRGVRLHAVIAGGGTAALSEDQLLCYIEERNLRGTVEVAGRVDERRRAHILGNCDVFLYPSRHDLAPLALIEAMAHGCAPLVLDIGGLRDMGGPQLAGNVLDANLVGADLADALAERLAAYAADRRSLAAARRAARARYLENYSPEMFRKRLEALMAGGEDQASVSGLEGRAEPMAPSHHAPEELGDR